MKHFILAALIGLLAGGCVTTSSATCPKPDDPNVLATLSGVAAMTRNEAHAVRWELSQMSPGCKDYWRREIRQSLKRVQKLLKQELITPDEAAEKRREILNSL